MKRFTHIDAMPFWVAVLLIAGCSVAFGGQDCPGKGVALQVLGSGGPEFYDGRASASYLVWHKGQAVVMLDAGSGSKFRFGQSGADFNTVRAVLFTHLHVDHSVDFPAYIKSAFFSGRNQTLYVYGPQGNRYFPSTSNFIQALIGDKNSGFPYLDSYLDGSDEYRIEIKSLSLDKRNIINILPSNASGLSAVAVHHGPLPAMAWRVDVAGKSIVFSGDMNGDYGTLPKLAMNADILVAHNAVSEDASGVARNLHMPPSVIGAIAKQANVKQLVLSHRMQRTLGREKQTLSIIQKHYAGPVIFADDLGCFVP
jgi:ribonuclease BN (tRNA processing enzyme)